MLYTTNHRINVRTIRKMTNNQIIFLRDGKIVHYEHGWHISVTGRRCWRPEDVSELIRKESEFGRGAVSIQFHNGDYYVYWVDHCMTKQEAEKIARKHGARYIYRCGGPQEGLVRVGDARR